MDASSPGQGDGAIISPSFAYGFSTSIHGNLYHLEGQKLLYPAGQFFAVMGAEDGKAFFIPTHSAVKAVRGLRLASNKKYLAAVEETYDADKQQVSVYNLAAEKRVRTLTMEKQHTHADTVISVSFSGDGKLLMIAAGEPDYTIMLWRWHTNKLVMTISPDCQVCCATINPWDESSLAVASNHLVRSYKLDLAGATARPNNHLMLDHNGDAKVTCLVYLVGGLLAVGTSTGRITVYSEGGLVAQQDISSAAPLSSSGKQLSEPSTALQTPRTSSRPSTIGAVKQGFNPITSAVQATKSTSSAAAGEKNAVQALVQRGRGFVVAGSNFDVFFFDPPAATTKRTAGVESYILSRRLSFALSSAKMPNQQFLSLSSSGGTDSGNAAGSAALAAGAKVLGMSVSVTDDHLALTTAAGKLLLLDITAALEALQDADDAAAAVAGSVSVSGDPVGQLASTTEGVTAEAGSSTAADSTSADSSGHDDADPNPTGWQVLCAGFPSARVVGLDATQHLPLVLVVSEDKWVRVWDWVRRTQIAARYLADEQPLCCTLHPSGTMAALGTTDTLNLYYILRHELASIAELPVAKCSVVRYSHGGSMLAAVGRTNAIVIYPAYYGGGMGASGINPVHWHGNTTTYYTQSSNSGTRRGAGEPAGVGSDGACLLRPLWVLKAHVSTVTDLVFSGDDTRLVSSGAGGAVYFWDLATGSRIMELEYVDKKCVYYAASYHDRSSAAVVRTMDGRLQHLQDGRLAFEVAGLGHDASPMALTGDGRVLLAGTSRGSVISIPWPKDPQETGQQQQQMAALAADDAGGFGAVSQQQDHNQGIQSNETPGLSQSAAAQHSQMHAGLLKHLSVQVEAGGSLSPRSSVLMPGTAAAAKTSGSSLAAKTPQAAKTPLGAKTPGRAATAAHTPAAAAAVAGTQGSASGNQQDKTSQPGDRQAGSDTAPGSHQGFKEYRLHAARITAMKMLHSSGILFTASADGLVMMSSITLVLDGILIDPPPLALPPSATITSTAAAEAAQMVMGPNATLAAGAGAVVVPGGVPGMPLPIVLVDEGLVLALKERIRGMAMQVVAIRKEAQYQVYRQTQALRESLGASDTQAAALHRKVEQLRKALADNQAAADTAQQQAVKELESLHVAAAEELEGLYEARLALEQERLAQLQAAKDDLELSLKEEMKRRSTAAEQLMQEVHTTYKQQLAEEATKAESAAATAAENAAMWQEVLMQTEEDLEQQAEKDSEKLALAEHKAGEAEVKLKAEINIINRTNARLKADKAADTSKISELTKQVEGLNGKISEAAVGADKLRRELAERDGVIAENYRTLQGLRRRVQELETHKFVLSYKAESAAAELQPKDEQITAIQQTVDAQDRELLAGHSALLAAQRAVTEKNTAVAAAKQEVWEAKQTITHQAGLLDAVAHDIFNVLQQPEERVPGGKTARQQALEALAVKYCTPRGGGPRSSVQIEQEMVAHIAAAERKSKLLEDQMKQALTSKKLGARHLMADNTALLADIAAVAHMNKDLQRQVTAACNQLAHFGLRLSGTNITNISSADNIPESPGAASGSVKSGAAAGKGKTDAGIDVAAGSNSRPRSPAGGPSLRSQGGPTPPGVLLPGSAGRVLSSAIEQQQQELEQLKDTLAATANVIANQAAQIQQLQDCTVAAQRPAADTGQVRPGNRPDPTEAALAAVEKKAAALGAGSYARSGIGFARGLAAMYDLSDSGGGSLEASPATEVGYPGRLRSPAAKSSGRPATAANHRRPSSRASPAAGRPRSASTGRARPSTAVSASGAKTSGMLGSPSGRASPGSGSGHQISVSESLAGGHHSPPANFPKRRPTTAGGVGMLACLKSDIEAWRTK